MFYYKNQAETIFKIICTNKALESRLGFSQFDTIFKSSLNQKSQFSVRIIHALYLLNQFLDLTKKNLF